MRYITCKIKNQVYYRVKDRNRNRYCSPPLTQEKANRWRDDMNAGMDPNLKDGKSLNYLACSMRWA